MPAINRLKRLRLLILELPQQLRLAYCLARDPRTPAPLKAALAGSLALILNPAIDLPAWVPVVGQMDAIALTVLTVRTFNARAPRELRESIEADIRAGRSRFDLDLRQGVTAAGRLALLARAIPGRARRRRRPLPAVGRPTEAAPWYRSPASAGGRTAAAGGEVGSDGPLPSASEEHSS
jgi:uncharacterized membrane protein YkvA (DUF1232 family)